MPIGSAIVDISIDFGSSSRFPFRDRTDTQPDKHTDATNYATHHLATVSVGNDVVEQCI